MKHLTLTREYLPHATTGTIIVKSPPQPHLDLYLETLELPWNDNKINESCIPEGEYVVERDYTGRHRWYAVQDVPGRTFIELHPGTLPSHSAGCILFPEITDLQDLMIALQGDAFTLNIVKG